MHFRNMPPNFDLTIGDSDMIESYCAARALVADGGGWIQPMANINGCAGKKLDGFGDIHISRSHPEILPHEMAHLTGKKNPDEEGYAWPW